MTPREFVDLYRGRKVKLKDPAAHHHCFIGITGRVEGMEETFILGAFSDRVSIYFDELPAFNFIHDQYDNKRRFFAPHVLEVLDETDRFAALPLPD